MDGGRSVKIVKYPTDAHGAGQGTNSAHKLDNTSLSAN